MKTKKLLSPDGSLRFADAAELGAYLTTKKVPWRKWTTRITKSLEYLFGLITDKIVVLEEEDGKPVLFSHDVAVDVCCLMGDSTLKILAEKHRRFPGDVNPTMRKTRHTLISKIKPEETGSTAAKRAVIEILKFRNSFEVVVRRPAEPYLNAAARYRRPGSIHIDSCLLIELESYDPDPTKEVFESFPGLETRRARQVFLCLVPVSAYQLNHTHVYHRKRTVYEYILLRENVRRLRYDPHYTMEKYQPLE